jgi:GntR family transcriptional regulator
MSQAQISRSSRTPNAAHASRPVKVTQAIRVTKSVKAKPRYSEVADQIRLQIMTGRYPIGSLLPSETDLRAEYSVSRHTIREATRQLSMSGLVSPEHGRGVRVVANKDAKPINVVFGSMEGIERYGRMTHLVDVHFRTIAADESLAHDMRCAPGDDLLHIQSFREPRDPTTPTGTAWNETYVLGMFSSIAKEVETWSGPIYSLIEQRFSERVVFIRQEVTALNLKARVAQKLKVRPGVAGLQVKRTYINADGQPLLIGVNTYVGSSFTLAMEIKS